MILQNEYINANIGDPEEEIFGYMETMNKGAFFSLILKCDEGTSLLSLCANDIILVFSKTILNDPRYTYHISNNWAGGIQFEPLIPGKKSRNNIKTYGNVDEYIENNRDKICMGNHFKNEIVFQENVPLSYLSEIWICFMSGMHKRINTKREDGGYNRIFQTVDFDPYDIESKVQILLSNKGIYVPVKLITEIPII